MKLLNGAELAGFIKQRHAQQVRALNSNQIYPKLAIIRTNSDRVVDIYMRLKTSYGEDVGVAVEVHDVAQSKAKEVIDRLNKDPATHGIIVQLPIPDSSQTEEILDSVAPKKDVDGLNKDTIFDAATPTAILWLLNGYNIDLIGRKIVVVGQGRLVGGPLYKMLKASGFDVQAADKNTQDLDKVVAQADVIISATGKAGLITNEMVKHGAVVVDAGTSADSNGLIGDVAADVRKRDDVIITPESGGVGPLTVSALFENVIRAASVK